MFETLIKYQKLDEEFIKNYLGNSYFRFITKYQRVSKAFIKEHNLKVKDEDIIIGAEFYCGEHRRSIYIYKRNPKVIVMGCFIGTKKEAIKAIKSKYKHNKRAKSNYIKKVEACFKQAKEY